MLDAHHLFAHSLVQLGDPVERVSDLGQQRIVGHRKANVEVTFLEVSHGAEQPAEIAFANLAVAAEIVHVPLTVSVPVAFSVSTFAADAAIFSARCSGARRTGRALLGLRLFDFVNCVADLHDLLL